MGVWAQVPPGISVHKAEPRRSWRSGQVINTLWVHDKVRNGASLISSTGRLRSKAGISTLILGLGFRGDRGVRAWSHTLRTMKTVKQGSGHKGMKYKPRINHTWRTSIIGKIMHRSRAWNGATSSFCPELRLALAGSNVPLNAVTMSGL